MQQDPNQSNPNYPPQYQQPQYPGQAPLPGQYPQQPYAPQYGQQPQYPGQAPLPGQYPQQPYAPQYGQQPPAPPAKKKRSRGCLIAGIVGVVLLVVIIAVAASSGGKGQTTATTNNTNTTSSATATTAPTQASDTAHKVGDSVTVGGWGIVVKSLTTSQNDPLGQLKSGDTYLQITVSLKNNTGKNQTFSSLIAFGLTDSNGQKYNQSLTSGATSPDGTVANGNPLQGVLAYEIPASTKAFILTFTPSLASTDSATWNLSL